jgi:competence protein ComEA
VPAIAVAQPRPVPIAMLAPPLEGTLNVNAATAEQWELLPGIGPTTAARILAFIATKPLSHTSQLMRVKGIGRKTYDRIKPYLVLEGETTLRIAEPSAKTP